MYLMSLSRPLSSTSNLPNYVVIDLATPVSADQRRGQLRAAVGYEDAAARLGARGSHRARAPQPGQARTILSPPEIQGRSFGGVCLGTADDLALAILEN